MKEKIIKILLVEDDPNDAEFVKDCLLQFVSKDDLFHVRNGAEALDYVFKKGIYLKRSASDDPKLILLDLKTPKINGLEVLQKIKSDEDTKSIPVVILTSSKEEKDQVNSYKYGANSFVIKPIEYEVFERTIKGIGEYWIKINQL